MLQDLMAVALLLLPAALMFFVPFVIALFVGRRSGRREAMDYISVRNSKGIA